MRLILQRVTRAVVRVEGEAVAQIGRGILVFAGIEKGDTQEQVETAINKLGGLRIFDDAAGRMNQDSTAIGGAFLVVSQFTLAGSLAKGRRPSFDRAAPAEEAEPLVESLARGLREQGFEVATGSFGAHMEVDLVNDGPVTFIFDVPVTRTGS